MRRFPAAALLCLALLPALAGAEPAPEYWRPLPADVWAMTEASLPGGLGAVNLARRLRVTDTAVLNEFRIRICSQRGRRAAEFTPFAKDGTVVGRVVYPDGRELAFDSQKDFHLQTSLSTRDREIQEKVLVPPGLTDDCVVDLRWEEPRYWAYWAKLGRGSESWHLASSFPTRILTIEVSRANWFDFFFNSGGLACVPYDAPGFKVLTIKDVPASIDVPFSLRSVRNSPLLKLYVQGNLIRAASPGQGGLLEEGRGALQGLLHQGPGHGHPLPGLLGCHPHGSSGRAPGARPGTGPAHPGQGPEPEQAEPG